MPSSVTGQSQQLLAGTGILWNPPESGGFRGKYRNSCPTGIPAKKSCKNEKKQEFLRPHPRPRSCENSSGKGRKKRNPQESCQERFFESKKYIPENRNYQPSSHVDLDFCTSFLKILVSPKGAIFLCLSVYLCSATQQAPPAMEFSYFQHNESRAHVPLLYFSATPEHFYMTPSLDPDPDQSIIEKCPGITTSAVSAHVISCSTAK